MTINNEAQITNILDITLASRVVAKDIQHQKEFQNDEQKRNDTSIKDRAELAEQEQTKGKRQDKERLSLKYSAYVKLERS